MRQRMYIVLAIVMLLAASAFAAGPGDLLGLWNTEEKDAKIEIYKCGTKYCGKIAWLKEPNYPAGSKEGAQGMPILDHNNPNPELRNKPLIGLPILVDFVFVGGNLWTDGKIYNSDNGKIYDGNMRLVSHDRLNVRGFIGISLIGGTTTWTRAGAAMQ